MNVLDTIREIIGAGAEITTVVGAGGNRDHGKRPIMAHEAAVRSDLLILTSDNPRDEEPEAIIEDMKAGLDNDEMRRTLCITDRRGGYTHGYENYQTGKRGACCWERS